MKKLILLLLLLPLLSSAQNIFPVNSNGAVEYKGVNDVTADKSEIYKRAKLWIASYFNSPKLAMQMDDKENGILKVNYLYPFIEGRELKASLQILIKDNKYQYVVNNILTPVEARLQDNMTAEGVLKRIKEKTDKGKTPIKFLTDYESTADLLVKNTIESLNKSLTTTVDF